MNSAINWFEIPVTDFDRATRFYGAIYATDLPARDTGTVHMAFIPYEQGNGIGGSLVSGPGYTPATNGIKLYLNAGDDLSVMLARVEAAGGKILEEKHEIAPGVGFCALIEDTEGNRVYLHSMN
jgi:predicted enzyme related to lactoylglutathione lyase